MKNLFLTLALCAIASIASASAVVTEAVEFVSTGTSARDGVVYVTRSGADLIFYDAGASTTTLSSLGAGVTDHGALSGLSDDDHSAIYINTSRHTSTHDATFNNALAISGDVGGEVTAGAHYADTAVHYIRNANLYEVYQDGTGPYATISAAIAQAISDSPAKAVIFIGEGQYNETITLPGVGEPIMYIVGSGRDASRIFSSESGGVVATGSSGNTTFINLTVENTATGAANNRAISMGTGDLTIENCLVKNANDSFGAIAGGLAAAELTIRNSEITGGYTLLSGTIFVSAYNSTFNHVANVADETFDITGTSNWEFYNCTHIGALNKLAFGTGNMAGGFNFNTAGGKVFLLGLQQSGSAELKLFQAGSASGTAYITSANYDTIGGASNITVSNYNIGQTDFSERVKIFQNNAIVPLQVEREVADSGNYINVTDENDTLLAYLDDDGFWNPRKLEWATATSTDTYWLSPYNIITADLGGGLISAYPDFEVTTTPSIVLDLDQANEVGINIDWERFSLIDSIVMQYSTDDTDPMAIKFGIGEYSGVATTHHVAYGTTTTTTAMQEQRFDFSDITTDDDNSYWAYFKDDTEATGVTLTIYRIGIVYGVEP